MRFGAAHEVTWPLSRPILGVDSARGRLGFIGRSEPVLVYTKQGKTTTHRGEDLGNAYTSVPGAHSVKPADWLRAWLMRWTDPGDLVVDLYAGMAPLAHACLATGRRYVGAEIDEERHARACGLLASWASALLG